MEVESTVAAQIVDEVGQTRLRNRVRGTSVSREQPALLHALLSASRLKREATINQVALLAALSIFPSPAVLLRIANRPPPATHQISHDGFISKQQPPPRRQRLLRAIPNSAGLHRLPTLPRSGRARSSPLPIRHLHQTPRSSAPVRLRLPDLHTPSRITTPTLHPRRSLLQL